MLDLVEARQTSRRNRIDRKLVGAWRDSSLACLDNLRTLGARYVFLVSAKFKGNHTTILYPINGVIRQNY